MTTRKDRVSELAERNLAAGLEARVDTQNLTAALEALVDRHGAKAVLLDLAFICAEKADHIRSNWQDEVTAKAWDRAAKACDRLQLKTEV